MAANEFTVRDFVDLVKELNEHEADLKIKLAAAGAGEGVKQSTDRNDRTREGSPEL